MKTERFIPATMSRPIGGGVFFRPIRSWHSGTYAGERLESIPGTNDGSGCLFKERIHDVLRICSPPHTVNHRLYWHERDPTKTVSVFLSYPDAMGCSDGHYFWETYGVGDGDVERYFGENAEAEMEIAVVRHFAALVT